MFTREGGEGPRAPGGIDGMFGKSAHWCADTEMWARVVLPVRLLAKVTLSALCERALLRPSCLRSTSWLSEIDLFDSSTGKFHHTRSFCFSRWLLTGRENVDWLQQATNDHVSHLDLAQQWQKLPGPAASS